jgi:hypothetical protein
MARYEVSVHEYSRGGFNVCLQPFAISFFQNQFRKSTMSMGNAAGGCNAVDPINKWLAVNVSVSVTNEYGLAGGDAAPGWGRAWPC